LELPSATPGTGFGFTLKNPSGLANVIQYSTNLQEWLDLTNTVQNSLVIHDVQSPQIPYCFYRSKMEAASAYAPSQLTAGETYQFTTTFMDITTLETLVVNSPTSGLLIRTGSAIDNGITEVTLNYQALGLRAARLEAVWPTDPMNPMGRTNTYLLAFIATNGGLFDKSSEPAMSQTGSFVRDVGLVGQVIASLQLTAGETYQLTSISAGITSLETLVVNSATSGLLIKSGNTPESGITEVTLQYQRLGPLVARLEAVYPTNSTNPTGASNVYILAYDALNGGFFDRTSEPAMTQSGTFMREQWLVGQVIESSQLTAGETYQFTSISAGITNIDTLVVNSSVSGLMIKTGNLPESGIKEVALKYQQLGPLAARVEVTYPTNSTNPMGKTNTYVLAYVALNGGFFDRTSEPAMTQTGTFVREQWLVGQVIASSQLTAGETYQFTSISAGITNLDTLVVNSATSGLLIKSGNMLESGIAEVTLKYQQLGPLAARVEAVYPVDVMNPMGRTNIYVLAYVALNGGIFDKTGDLSMTQTGTFVRDMGLVGQVITSSQLTAGEIYQFTSISAGITNLDTLVVNSATGGLLIKSGNTPENGIAEVTLKYQQLGPLMAHLEVFFPVDMMNPMGKTNVYVLVYVATDGGLFNKSGEPAMTQAGSFVRGQNLVGQVIASWLLTAGEIYQFTSISAGMTNLEMLVLNSANSGLLSRSGNFNNGITEVALHYQHLGPLVARLEVVYPIDSMNPMGKTNVYFLAYIATNGGLFVKSGDPAMSQTGSFVRDQGLAGRTIASSQLAGGDIYEFTSISAGMTNLEMVVVNSADSGLLIRYGNLPESGITEVALKYQQLGPLAARMDVMEPMNPMGQTNTYFMAFIANNGGIFERKGSSATTQTGYFQRTSP
jgi:hypothetical protein